jgi:hypothetical protein
LSSAIDKLKPHSGGFERHSGMTPTEAAVAASIDVALHEKFRWHERKSFNCDRGRFGLSLAA